MELYVGMRWESKDGRTAYQIMRRLLDIDQLTISYDVRCEYIEYGQRDSQRKDYTSEQIALYTRDMVYKGIQ